MASSCVLDRPASYDVPPMVRLVAWLPAALPEDHFEPPHRNERTEWK